MEGMWTWLALCLEITLLNNVFMCLRARKSGKDDCHSLAVFQSKEWLIILKSRLLLVEKISNVNVDSN